MGGPAHGQGATGPAVPQHLPQTPEVCVTAVDDGAAPPSPSSSPFLLFSLLPTPGLHFKMGSPHSGRPTRQKPLPSSQHPGPKLNFPNTRHHFLDTRPHMPYKLTTEAHHSLAPGDITPLSPGCRASLECSSDVHRFSLPSFKQLLGGQYRVSLSLGNPHLPPPARRPAPLPLLGARSAGLPSYRDLSIDGSQH